MVFITAKTRPTWTRRLFSARRSSPPLATEGRQPASRQRARTSLTDWPWGVTETTWSLAFVHISNTRRQSSFLYTFSIEQKWRSTTTILRRPMNNDANGMIKLPLCVGGGWASTNLQISTHLCRKFGEFREFDVVPRPNVYCYLAVLKNHSTEHT